MKKITSLANPFIRSLAELKKNAVKKEREMFLVDGSDFIEAAYESGHLLFLLTSEEVSKFQNCEQVIVAPEILKRLSPNVTTQKMVGVCRYPEWNSVSGTRLLYLDGVQDPGNVGTLIRTALAFSYDGVILSKDSASVYNDKVISSSKGALFRMPVYEEITLDQLKKKGYTLISTALHQAVDYRSVEPTSPIVLILGNEGNGVRKENLLLSDRIVKIPMSGIDSLNVAIAGGILMNYFREV